MPMFRAVVIIVLSGGTSFGTPAMSDSLLWVISLPFSATVTPYTPSRMSSAACTPNCVDSTRS